MVAYCLNNPVNYSDKVGKDAIWIQEESSAFTMGHTGLLVQDSYGNWWYFYWGAADQGADLVNMITGTPAVCILESVDTSNTDLHNTVSIKMMFYQLAHDGNPDNDPFFADQWNNISGTMYFYGDYSDTLEFLQDLQEKANAEEVDYKLLEFNCCQLSCEALGQSDPRFMSVPALVPNIAYVAYVRHFSPHSKSFTLLKG